MKKVIIPKKFTDDFVCKVIECAKKEEGIKSLYKVNRKKYYSSIKSFILPDEEFIRDEQIISDALRNLVFFFYRRGKNGRDEKCLKLNCRLVRENDNEYEFELSEEE